MNTMTEQELLPCPFCDDYGAELTDSAMPSIVTGKPKKAVYCNTCFCEGPTSDTEAGAVEAWNLRATASIQPVAASEPDAWMHNNLKTCTTAASKRWMENAGFGAWAEVAASYTIPLYTAAPAQAWTALTPEELVMANEAIRQMAHGFMPNTVDLFRRLVAAAPAQAAPDKALVQALQDIVDPIGAMKRDVPEGQVLNPHMAVQMADDPQWYKRRAQQALDALRTTSTNKGEAA